MTDLRATPVSGEGINRTSLYHDEADGSFSQAVAPHLRGWDETDGEWYRVPVDHLTGALKVTATLTAGSIEIGTVDQGASGAQAWKVDGSAVTQPVSGTFWQATQPVSLASVPSHPVTNAGVFAVQASWAAAQHVIVDTAPTTAVTGTFWQATQPVSIASMPSTPVTGTFWQATQPVSGTVAVSNFPAGFANTDDVTDRAARLLGHVTVDSSALPTGAATEATALLSRSDQDSMRESLNVLSLQSILEAEEMTWLT